MQIWHGFKEAKEGLGERLTAISIGTFDGVHLGHQAVLGELDRLARERSLVSLAITFTEHPAALVDGDAPPLLLPVPQRLELIGSLGMQAILLLDFDAPLAGSTPASFVRERLFSQLGLRMLVIGHDFRFGAGGDGDAKLLRRLGSELGFSVHEVPPVYSEGTLVSSTAIRWALAAGDVRAAAGFLGRPFAVRGLVVQGERRGRRLGYPTANIRLAPGALWPRYGVYLVRIELAPGVSYRGVANVGVKPTFGRNAAGVEVYLFGYTGDLYGSTIEVAFLDFLRPERQFADAGELRRQIQADLALAQGLNRP